MAHQPGLGLTPAWNLGVGMSLSKAAAAKDHDGQGKDCGLCVGPRGHCVWHLCALKSGRRCCGPEHLAATAWPCLTELCQAISMGKARRRRHRVLLGCTKPTVQRTGAQVPASPWVLTPCRGREKAQASLSLPLAGSDLQLGALGVPCSGSRVPRAVGLWLCSPAPRLPSLQTGRAERVCGTHHHSLMLASNLGLWKFGNYF